MDKVSAGQRAGGAARGPLVISKPAWMRRGACRDQQDPDLHFPAGEGRAFRRQIIDAKQVCAGCPVLAECREHSFSEPEPYGIWGGLTEGERRDVRARQIREAQELARHAGDQPAPDTRVSTGAARRAVTDRIAEREAAGAATVRTEDFLDLVKAGVRARSWFRYELLRLAAQGRVTKLGRGDFGIVPARRFGYGRERGAA